MPPSFGSNLNVMLGATGDGGSDLGGGDGDDDGGWCVGYTEIVGGGEEGPGGRRGGDEGDGGSGEAG